MASRPLVPDVSSRTLKLAPEAEGASFCLSLLRYAFCCFRNWTDNRCSSIASVLCTLCFTCSKKCWMVDYASSLAGALLQTAASLHECWQSKGGAVLLWPP